jgi:hypothetical protein
MRFDVRQENMETDNPKKQSLGCISIIGVLLVAGLAKTLVGSLFNSKSSSPSSSVYSSNPSKTNASEVRYEDVLRMTAERMSAQLPMKIDTDTSMDSVSSGPGRVFTYNYTVTTGTKDQIDFAAIESAFRPKLLNNYKHSHPTGRLSLERKSGLVLS